MNQELDTVVGVLCRLIMIGLCALVIAKRYECKNNCTMIRRRLESVVSWVSAAVVAIGMFFPIPAGIASAILISNLLWMQTNGFAREKATTGFVSAATSKDNAVRQGNG
jgi:hypothetical protein